MRPCCKGVCKPRGLWHPRAWDVDARYVLLDITQAPPSHRGAEGDAGWAALTKTPQGEGKLQCCICLLGYLLCTAAACS